MHDAATVPAVEIPGAHVCSPVKKLLGCTTANWVPDWLWEGCSDWPTREVLGYLHAQATPPVRELLMLSVHVCMWIHAHCSCSLKAFVLYRSYTCQVPWHFVLHRSHTSGLDPLYLCFQLLSNYSLHLWKVHPSSFCVRFIWDSSCMMKLIASWSLSSTGSDLGYY